MACLRPLCHLLNAFTCINHVASATRALVCLVTLTFDLLTMKLMRIITHVVDNLPTNFWVSETFRSPVMGQQLLDAQRDVATLTFDLGGYGACR